MPCWHSSLELRLYLKVVFKVQLVDPSSSVFSRPVSTFGRIVISVLCRDPSTRLMDG